MTMFKSSCASNRSGYIEQIVTIGDPGDHADWKRRREYMIYVIALSSLKEDADFQEAADSYSSNLASEVTRNSFL